MTLMPPFHGLGVWLYLVLWFLMPVAPGEASGLDRAVDAVNGLLAGGSRPERDERWESGDER